MNTNTAQSRMVFGEVASAGVVRGSAVVCSCTAGHHVARRKIGEDEVFEEIGRFNAAISAVEGDLLKVQKDVRQEIGAQEAGILDAQILLLHDTALREEVSRRCLSDRLNVEAAVDEAIEKLTGMFLRLEDPYLRERAADLRDVGRRLLEVLAQRRQPGIPAFPDDAILVTSELLPSVMAQLSGRKIRGLIAEQGGQNAHATILARAQSIPFIIHVPRATEQIRSDDQLIVDGLAGRVFINPTEEMQREYIRLEADLQAHQTALEGLVDLPAETRDGVPVKLCANIGKVADAKAAAIVNADGVGLYRTEFVFLAQDHFPSEEEQYRMYLAAADQLKQREMVIRVLDAGSDKLLPYFPLPRESNPSLGCRGLRLLLAHPDILRTQFRAILRLSATHPVSILLPMVGGVEDIRAAREILESVKADLAAEQQPFNPDTPLGAMVETPAAAIMIRQLAQEVDFFSIGTNDLVQYLLTTDRTSDHVSSYYEPLHPAVLTILASVVSAVATSGKRVSVCGEMAGNPSYTALLLGLGFRSFSVNPGDLLEVKNAIRSVHLRDAEQLAIRLLEYCTIQEVRVHLRKAGVSAAFFGEKSIVE